MCLEEEEDDHGRLGLLSAQTGLSGRPAEPGGPALLRQAIGYRDGRAHAAGWVRALLFVLGHWRCSRLNWLTLSVCTPLCPLDSCFLTSNDLTHSLSSYLKEGEDCSSLGTDTTCWHLDIRPSVSSILIIILACSLSLVCPKWAKVQKQHTEKSSVVLLIVCSSALRTIELIKWVTDQWSSFIQTCCSVTVSFSSICVLTACFLFTRQLTTFKGEAKVLKLFAKHIKVTAR